MPLPEAPVASIGNGHPFLLAFRSARFRFRLRAVSHVELPAEKGSTFHGAFGHVLKREVERAECFGLLYHRDARALVNWVRGRYHEPRPLLRRLVAPSGHQHTWIKFGGLLGKITYRGDLTPFLPWFALGEWTHIGGKTSFGSGGI